MSTSKYLRSVGIIATVVLLVAIALPASRTWWRVRPALRAYEQSRSGIGIESQAFDGFLVFGRNGTSNPTEVRKALLACGFTEEVYRASVRDSTPPMTTSWYACGWDIHGGRVPYNSASAIVHEMNMFYFDSYDMLIEIRHAYYAPLPGHHISETIKIPR